MRAVSAILLAALCVACDPPPPKAPVGAAVVDAPRPKAPLPDAVAATVKQLYTIAQTGTYRDMVALAAGTETFRSNNAGMSHSEYWYLKQRTGDEPTVQLMRVLSLEPAVRDSPMGRVWIWPGWAVTDPDRITPADAREIDALLGQGAAAAVKRGEIWPGYVLGIGEDGRWLYFVSGSG